MQTVDNFLSAEEFNDLESRILGDHIDWYWNDGITHEGDGLFQFTHTIFVDQSQKSPWPFLELFRSLLNVNTWVRVKANLRPRTFFHRSAGYHTDCADMTTAIYYPDTNNGWTQFKKGGKVKSVANRIVIFDSNLEHKGFSCTDANTRIVINFNWK